MAETFDIKPLKMTCVNCNTEITVTKITDKTVYPDPMADYDPNSGYGLQSSSSDISLNYAYDCPECKDWWSLPDNLIKKVIRVVKDALKKKK